MIYCIKNYMKGKKQMIKTHNLFMINRIEKAYKRNNNLLNETKRTLSNICYQNIIDDTYYNEYNNRVLNSSSMSEHELKECEHRLNDLEVKLQTLLKEFRNFEYELESKKQ